MRRIVLGLALALVLGVGAMPARAQNVNPGGFGDLSDPFTAYYSWYLPFQIQQAALPRPDDTIRAYSAARQQAALTERAGLYDPIGGLGVGYDPMQSFGVAGGQSRRARTVPQGMVNLNINGAGPTGYFNRSGTHYPTLRTGRSQAPRSPIGSGLHSSRRTGVSNGGFSTNPASGLGGGLPG